MLKCVCVFFAHLQICLLPNVKIMMAATETGNLRTYKYPLTGVGVACSNLLFSFLISLPYKYPLTGVGVACSNLLFYFLISLPYKYPLTGVGVGMFLFIIFFSYFSAIQVPTDRCFFFFAHLEVPTDRCGCGRV